MPTTQQAFTAVIVCQMISNLLRDIALFRYDQSTRELYIFTAENLETREDIQIVIAPNGLWRFVDEA